MQSLDSRVNPAIGHRFSFTFELIKIFMAESCSDILGKLGLQTKAVSFNVQIQPKEHTTLLGDCSAVLQYKYVLY